jgi:hypothetical protein
VVKIFAKMGDTDGLQHKTRILILYHYRKKSFISAKIFFTTDYTDYTDD